MPVYSHSRLSAFETCPRQYFLRYIARVQVDEEEGVEGFLGSLVHEALERLYRDRMFGKVMSSDALVGWFNAEWKKRWHDGIVVVRREYRPDDYRRVGEDCLRKYHARHAPFDDSTTIALEEKVTFNLDRKGKHKLQGYIDRLSHNGNGHYEIHDYKTNMRLPTQEEKDADRQLALYQIGISDRWQDVKHVDLIWHFLRFDKTIRSTRTEADLEQIRGDTIALIDEIESRGEEADFETKGSPLCDWCGFQQFCPLRKHLFRVAELPTNRFLKEPGVKLVNRLSDLNARASELREQMAAVDQEKVEVEEALLAYAKRERLESVVGSTHEAHLMQQTQITLPRKTQESDCYAELEKLLRRSTAWPAVSVMDVRALRRIWAEEQEDPGRVRRMLQRFVTEEESTKVSLRKRRGGSNDED